MIKFKRVFLLVILAFILISSSVLATTSDSLLSEDVPEVTSRQNTGSETIVYSRSTTSPKIETINKDCFISHKSSNYSLDNIVNGNVFATVSKFATNPRNGGGILSGNLYLIASEVIIGSDITYSNEQDSNNNYKIQSINSKSTINGSVYVITDSFTLEAGSEINGDLYIVADKVNIGQNSVIGGNVFITSKDVTINGQISGSAYVSCSNFNMQYFSYITRDLYLNSENANISGIIYRDALIYSENLKTVTGFRTHGNFTVSYAKECELAGEIFGDADINAVKLVLKNDSNEKCEIRGNLKYATKEKCDIPENVVKGNVSEEKFKDKSHTTYKFKDYLISFIALFTYILVTVILFKKFAPDAINNLPELDLKTVLIGLGFGLLSFLIVFALFVLLLVLKIGIHLAFALCFGYIFVLFLALPIFVYQIANTLNVKWNLLLKLFVIIMALYIIKFIPVLGSLVISIIFISGIGQIFINIFKKK